MSHTSSKVRQWQNSLVFVFFPYFIYFLSFDVDYDEVAKIQYQEQIVGASVSPRNPSKRKSLAVVVYCPNIFVDCFPQPKIRTKTKTHTKRPVAHQPNQKHIRFKPNAGIHSKHCSCTRTGIPQLDLCSSGAYTTIRPMGRASLRRDIFLKLYTTILLKV